MKHKVLLIGCGEHSRENLIPSLAGIETVEVIGICDDSDSALQSAGRWFPVAKKYDNSDFTIDELTKFDAAIVAAPPQIHQQIAYKCLEAGIPIFVEKPPTVNTADLIKLAELADSKNLVTCVGHNLRHSDAAIEFQNLIESARFGEPIAMEMRYMASKPRGPRWGIDDPLRSFLLSHANHAIDLMIYHMGAIHKIVSARAWPDVDGGVAIAVQFIFHSGAIGNLLASSYAPFFNVSTSVLSKTGWIAEMNGLQEVSVTGGGKKRWKESWRPRTLETGYRFAGYQTEFERFFQAISNKTPRRVHPSFKDEISIYEAMDEIENSIETGQNV